jgi:PAS domain S-box-containing protein
MQKSGFMKEKIANSEIQNVVREMVIESEQKYKLLVENSLVAILIYCDDHIVYANPRFNEIFGYTGEEYKDLNIWELIHPDQTKMVKERAYSRMRGESVEPQYEIRAYCKDGSMVDIMVKAVRMMYQGKSALHVNIIDITDLKNAQREIKELSKIVETALIPIIKTDSNGVILYMNKSAEKFFGVEMADLMDRPLSDMLSGIDPDEMHDHIIRQTRKAGFDAEILCHKHDGAPVKTRLTTCSLVNDDNEMTAIVCFLLDPAIQKAEKNLLNVDDPYSADFE